MEYLKTYLVKDDYINVRELMDAPYYRFYMEYCRYDYIRDILGFDFETKAKNGVYMVIYNYSLKITGSLKRGGRFSVNCKLYKDKNSSLRLYFKQIIKCRSSVMAQAVFTGTCVSALGGRSYLTASIPEIIKNAPVRDV